MMFQGNRRVTITAIGGAIVMSRTSGQTPCFVQASSSGITCTGSSWPYEDLEYRWDFGDPTGAETFTDPTTRLVRNANVQYGAEAAYCYRAAGTYTITLRVRGKAASGYITQEFTQAVTVSAWAGTDYWFDGVNGSDANDGLSIGAPKQSIAALNTLIGSNRRFNIARGTHWTGSAGVSITAAAYSNIRFNAYGSGALPIIEITSGGGNAISMTNGTASSSRTKDDIVFSNFDFRRSVEASVNPVVSISVAADETADITDVYFDNCTIRSTVGGSNPVCTFQGGTADILRAGLWNCDITATNTASVGNRMGFYGGATHWNFIVGGNVSGSGDNDILDHHIYSQIHTHGIFKWINFGYGLGKNFCINTNLSQMGGSLEYGEFFNMSGCYMSGALRAFDISETLGDISKCRFRNVVAEDNHMQGLDGDGVVLFYTAESLTLRRNKVWDCDGGRFYTPQAASATIYAGRVYDNMIYKTTGNGQMFYIPSGFTLAQEIYDNIVVDTRTTAKVFSISFSEMTAAGSYIDGNQVYSPNDSTPYYDGESTQRTVAQWQAAGWDVSGSASDPGWIDPANGVFDLEAGRFRFGIIGS